MVGRDGSNILSLEMVKVTGDIFIQDNEQATPQVIWLAKILKAAHKWLTLSFVDNTFA